MKSWKHLGGLVVISLLLSACISIPTGDGGKIKISKNGIDIEDKDGEKSSITVDTDEGGYTIETGEHVSKVGKDATVPADFPKDVLLPKNEDLLMASELEKDGLKSYVLAYNINGDINEDIESYLTYLSTNGYEVEKMEIGDSLKAYQGRKESHYLHYQFTSDDPSTYQMSVMYGELE